MQRGIISESRAIKLLCVSCKARWSFVLTLASMKNTNLLINQVAHSLSPTNPHLQSEWNFPSYDVVILCFYSQKQRDNSPTISGFWFGLVFKEYPLLSSNARLLWVSRWPVYSWAMSMCRLLRRKAGSPLDALRGPGPAVRSLTVPLCAPLLCAHSRRRLFIAAARLMMGQPTRDRIRRWLTRVYALPYMKRTPRLSHRLCDL